MITSMRAVLNGIFYVVKTGCQWAWLPRDFPPKGTVYYHYSKLKKLGVWDKILEHTNRLVRKKEGRSSDPTLGLIDSQSAKTIYQGKDRGFDGNKKVKGRKRHIVTDIVGCLLTVVVHAANIHDTVAACGVMEKAVQAYPSLEGFCGDEGYQGTAVAAASKLGRPMEISKKIVGDQGKEKKMASYPKKMDC